MIIVPADGIDIEMQKRILWLDAQCFPDSEGPLAGAGPVSFHGSHWFIVRPSIDFPIDPVAYAGWRPHIARRPLHWDKDYNDSGLHHGLGFLYRAGVLSDWRGWGTQKRLIVAREESMREHGIRESVTYTDPLSIGSMKNMIACGYEPYAPTEETYLCRRFEDAGRFVHWRRTL